MWPCPGVNRRVGLVVCQLNVPIRSRHNLFEKPQVSELINCYDAQGPNVQARIENRQVLTACCFNRTDYLADSQRYWVAGRERDEGSSNQNLPENLARA